MFTNHSEDSGITSTYAVENGKLVTRSVQDVGSLLDRAAKLRNDPDYARQGIKDGMQHVASIPSIVVVKWINEHGFNAMTAHPKEVMRFIEGRPEYHYLKTTTGRIA